MPVSEPEHEFERFFKHGAGPPFRRSGKPRSMPATPITGAKIQLESASCRMPLIACPLVQPWAMRAPSIMISPPRKPRHSARPANRQSATARAAALSPPAPITRHLRAGIGADEHAEDEHPFPVDLRRLVLLRLRFEVRLRDLRGGGLLGERGAVFKGRGDADGLVGGGKGQPAQHANAGADDVGRPRLSRNGFIGLLSCCRLPLRTRTLFVGRILASAGPAPLAPDGRNEIPLFRRFIFEER